MKKSVYQKLESTMVRYRDLIKVPVADTGESFNRIPQTLIPNGYIAPLTDMTQVMGPGVIVRRSVLKKLIRAQKILCATSPTLSLYVTYGYRSLAIQQKRFLWKLSDISKNGIIFENPPDLYEEVHRSIAVPFVAGHPTGGAVDITIKDLKNDKVLDFGSNQYDSTKNCYVFAPVKRAARTNRSLLRSVMKKSGFAPFDGEWWHFSYGDREWAYFYKKPKALYSQCSISQVKSNLLQCEL